MKLNKIIKNLSIKIFVFISLLSSICISEIFNEANKIEFNFNKDSRGYDYYNAFNKLRNQYINDPFLKIFLKEINLESYDYNENLKKNNNEIHVIVNMNSKYFYPTLVSINSALRNSNKNKTTLVYHILLPKAIGKDYINKIKSLLLIYPTNLVIIIYNMGKLFSKFKRNRFSEVTFYRLLSPLFIPLDKIIYMDSDVLVFKDLEEMYNLQFHNNYVLGYLDLLSDGVDYLGLISEKYINAGVLLLNLKLIRENKKFYELLHMAKYCKDLKNNDQTIINYIFYPNIGTLPLKYGIFNFDSIFDIKYLYLRKIRQQLNFTELIEAFKDPAIMHYTLCIPKVWNSNSIFSKKYTRTGTINRTKCQKYLNIWIENAYNTSFYKDIAEHYKLKT